MTIVSCREGKPKEQQEASINGTSNNITLTEAQATNSGIVIGNPQELELSSSIRLQGEVRVPPQSRVSITFPLGGYVRKTEIMPGAHVRKGQVLATVEDMEYIQLQQAYLTAKEKYIVTALEFERQKQLNAVKASSDKLFEQIRADKETQRIVMMALGQKLQLLGINPKQLTPQRINKSLAVVSPVNGLVSKVNVNVGMYIAATETMFELVNMEDVVLTFTAFEKDVAHLKTGQHLEVFSNSNPNTRYDAKIVYINNSLNNDRAAEIIARPQKHDAALLPGLFINADVEVTKEKQLAVPVGAIVEWKGKHYIFEQQGKNSFRMVKVTTGTTAHEFQHISSANINTSSKVVTVNAYTLLMKAMAGGEEE